MRLVVDTNVLLSALFWRSAPHELLLAAQTSVVSLISSPTLLAELSDVLNRSKFSAILARTGIAPEQVLAELENLMEIVIPTPLRKPASRDPDDDAVLATAVTAQADVIVSGDSDLLDLKRYEGIPMMTPAETLRRISTQIARQA